MGRRSDADRVTTWQERVRAACKVWDEWSATYEPAKLEELYLGHQWPKDAGPKYTINMCFPTVEVRMPSLLYSYPTARVTPRPPFIDDPGRGAIDDLARLLEDTANTIAQDERTGLYPESSLSLKEAFFYGYAVLEVGLSADYIDNPNAGRPVVEKDGSALMDGEQAVQEPAKVLNPERPDEAVYVRRIPASQFRVSALGKNRLDQCDWCGYYEWVPIADVRANPAYKNTAKLKGSGQVRSKYRASTDTVTSADYDRDDEGQRVEARRGLIKIWKVWDLRSMKRFVFPDTGDVFLREEAFEFLPFSALKFHEILDEFYPLPPMFNWRSPQAELNETREMQRVHRKRFYRRYTYTDGAIDEDELRKLEDGGDGVYARSNQPDPIKPVQDAPLDPAVVRNIPLTKDDFFQISGVGGEARGVAASDTATQAAIMDARSRVREDSARVLVARWLSHTFRLILQVITKHFTGPVWVRRNTDVRDEGATSEAARVAGVWQSVQAADLDGLNYEVGVDVESLSPLSEEAERQQWQVVLQLLTNQGLLVALSSSDVLLRKTLRLHGIKNERDVAQVRQAMQATLMALTGMQGGGGAPGMASPPGPAAAQGAAPGGLPAMAAQLAAEIGGQGGAAPQAAGVRVQ